MSKIITIRKINKEKLVNESIDLSDLENAPINDLKRLKQRIDLTIHAYNHDEYVEDIKKKKHGGNANHKPGYGGKGGRTPGSKDKNKGNKKGRVKGTKNKSKGNNKGRKKGSKNKNKRTGTKGNYKGRKKGSKNKAKRVKGKGGSSKTKQKRTWKIVGNEIQKKNYKGRKKGAKDKQKRKERQKLVKEIKNKVKNHTNLFKFDKHTNTITVMKRKNYSEFEQLNNFSMFPTKVRKVERAKKNTQFKQAKMKKMVYNSELINALYYDLWSPSLWELFLKFADLVRANYEEFTEYSDEELKDYLHEMVKQDMKLVKKFQMLMSKDLTPDQKLWILTSIFKKID